MLSNPQKTCIGDFFNLIGGYAFKGSDFIGSGIPVIKIKNVKANQMLYDNLSHVSDKFLNSGKVKAIQKGDLLITMSGNRFDGSPSTWVGKVAQFKEDHPFLLNQRVGILRPKDGVRLEQRFFAYSLSSDVYQNEFISIATSSGGQANLSPKQILGAPINVPTLPKQKAIAGILGSLDDKIELNRKMSETLEEMAGAIFKSWFMDFDPVVAKSEGLKPEGMDAETAKLFPDSFVESEIGRIPKGWRARPLTELIDVNPSRQLQREKVAPYLDMGALSLRSARTDATILRPFSSGSKFRNGDTLVARITPCLENGKTGFVDNLEDGETGWGSTEFIVLCPKAPLPSSYGYFLARTDEFRSFAITNMTGTSGRQRVVVDSFSHFFLAEPPSEIAITFGDIATDILKQMKAYDAETLTLSALRDSLLPKLLSGEIIVRSAL